MDGSALIHRIQKRLKHLSKWARKNNISCFRVYHRDIPEFPCAIDMLDGDIVCWIYDRKRDESLEQQEAFQTLVKEAVAEAFGRPQSEIFFKGRHVQKGLENQYEKLGGESVTKQVQESGLSFELNLSDYLDTGLFLDHRPTRVLCRDLAKGKRVLNLFAYTGSFSVYARAGGASAITTVDLSRHYIDWAQRNMAQNFPERPEDQFVVADCLRYLKDTQETFDLIICDPPTFSNSKKMNETFAINTHHVELITDCLNRLNPEGLLFFSTNSKTFKCQTQAFPDNILIKEITNQSIPEDFKGTGIHRSYRIEKGR